MCDIDAKRLIDAVTVHVGTNLHLSGLPTNQELSDLFGLFAAKTEVSISSDAIPEESYLPHDSRHSTGRKLRPNVRLDCGPVR